MPSTNPEMVEYGFAISPGTENHMTIKADMLQSNVNIDKISYLQRGCYMDEEKYLRFYQNYAYLNCFMECASNYTYHVSFMFYFTYCNVTSSKYGKQNMMNSEIF